MGTEARKKLEEMLGKKVFLELTVKVIEDWRNDEQSLKRFGYDSWNTKNEFRNAKQIQKNKLNINKTVIEIRISKFVFRILKKKWQTL